MRQFSASEEEKIHRLVKVDMRAYKKVAERFNTDVSTIREIVQRIENQTELDVEYLDEDDEDVGNYDFDVPTDVTYEMEWNGEKEIKFALMGDTQLSSKYAQITHLHDFYDKCMKRGITTVFHTGDIDEGEQMRAGHQYECYRQGADEHIDEIVHNYPKRVGITTYFITGNHDASLNKRCGLSIGKAIEDRRDDMKWLGQDKAVIKLTPNCTLELRHPWNGTTSSISLQSQKMVDGMPEYEKPDILAIGHYHKTEQIWYKGVNVFQTGAFQGTTPFTQGKNISVAVGGWIVSVKVKKDGSLKSIVSEYIPYPIDIKNDWKNWRY